MFERIEFWKSVHDIAADLGVILTNEQAWTVGSIVASKWEGVTGALPIKDLRPKKNGPGSHCFAIYPPTWAHVLSEAIANVRPATSPQGSLPF